VVTNLQIEEQESWGLAPPYEAPFL